VEEKKMKKLVGLVALLLLVGVAAYPFQMSFKVNYGVSMVGINGNDYNKAADTFTMYINDNYSSVVGEKGKMSFTPIFFQGEMIFSFTPSFGAGLGASFLSTSRSDAMSYTGWFGVSDETYQPKISAFSIFMNLHYSLPMGSRMKLDLFVGPVLAFGSFSYAETDTWILADLDYTFEATGTAFGFQTGLGFDFQLAKNISLVFDILYRFVPWANIQGTETVDGTALGFPVHNTYPDEFAWLGQDSDGDWLTFLTAQPTGYVTVDKAKLDLGGLTATIGIKIGLF
jgi:hypothetical protein